MNTMTFNVSLTFPVTCGSYTKEEKKWLPDLFIIEYSCLCFLLLSEIIRKMNFKIANLINNWLI